MATATKPRGSAVDGERVRALREDAGLSRDQLAVAAGISSDRLGAIERGEGGVRVDTLKAIADQLDATVDDLLR